MRGFYFIPAFILPITAAGPNPKVTVLVYNYAEISSKTLAQTEREAARIFQKSGIDSEWVDCPLTADESGKFPACPFQPRQADLILRIVPQSMADRLRSVRDSFGFTMFPDDGSMPKTANVFSHDAEQIAKKNRVTSTAVLATVTAHEIGHLLLGPESHSSGGIMKAHWRRNDLQTIARGWMTFTPEQSEKMRSGAQARMTTERLGQ